MSYQGAPCSSIFVGITFGYPNLIKFIEGYHTVEKALPLNTTGRPPKPKLIDDLESKDGRTLYIGKRENGKVIRIYEKGKQLGRPDSPWCRAELEIHNKD